jgi:hypothetical protein
MKRFREVWFRLVGKFVHMIKLWPGCILASLSKGWIRVYKQWAMPMPELLWSQYIATHISAGKFLPINCKVQISWVLFPPPMQYNVPQNNFGNLRQLLLVPVNKCTKGPKPVWSDHLLILVYIVVTSTIKHVFEQNKLYSYTPYSSRDHCILGLGTQSTFMIEELQDYKNSIVSSSLIYVVHFCLFIQRTLMTNTSKKKTKSKSKSFWNCISCVIY